MLGVRAPVWQGGWIWFKQSPEYTYTIGQTEDRIYFVTLTSLSKFKTLAWLKYYFYFCIYYILSNSVKYEGRKYPNLVKDKKIRWRVRPVLRELVTSEKENYYTIYSRLIRY